MCTRNFKPRVSEEREREGMRFFFFGVLAENRRAKFDGTCFLV